MTEKNRFQAPPIRLQIALACGGTGWILSLALRLFEVWGVRYYPDFGVHSAAFLGAFLAGLALATGFGRVANWGVPGIGLSMIFALLTTLSGALFSGALLPFIQNFSLIQLSFLDIAEVVLNSSVLGALAVFSALENWPVVYVWLVAMSAVDVIAARARRAQGGRAV